MVLSKHAERREMAAAGANPGMGPGTGMTGGMHHAMGPTDAGVGAGTMTGTRHGVVGSGPGLTGRSNNPMAGNGVTGTTGAGGMGTAGGAGTAAPGAMNNTNPQARSSGTMKNIEGKVEKTLGNLTCNPTLKMKGVQKEQEAAAVRMQNTHLTEAERLEQAAGAHRQRAVVSGAHPDQGHVGGAAVPGQAMGNQPGTGGIGGNPIMPGGGASHGGAAY